MRLDLVSNDVTHGFFSKPLKLDEVIVPDNATSITLNTQAPGKYTVICDHFCGEGHGNMAMSIVVEE